MDRRRGRWKVSLKGKLGRSAAGFRSVRANLKGQLGAHGSELKTATAAATAKLKCATIGATAKLKSSAKSAKIFTAPMNKLRSLKRAPLPDEVLMDMLGQFSLASNDTYSGLITASIGDDDSLQMQWFRCPGDGAARRPTSAPLLPLPGVTGLTYQPTIDDVGAVIRCVCMSSTGLSASAQTQPLAPSREASRAVDAIVRAALHPDGKGARVRCAIPTHARHDGEMLDIVLERDGLHIEQVEKVLAPASAAAIAIASRAVAAAVTSRATGLAAGGDVARGDGGGAARAIAAQIAAQTFALAVAAAAAPRVRVLDHPFHETAACVALQEHAKACALDIGDQRAVHIGFRTELLRDVFVVATRRLLAQRREEEAAALERANAHVEIVRSGFGAWTSPCRSGATQLRNTGAGGDVTAGGNVVLASSESDSESESDGEDAHVWWYTDISSNGVGVRRDKRYPGERVGIDVNGGLTIPIIERVVVSVPLPEPIDAGAEGAAARGNSRTRDVTFLRLADRRGWLFDVSPSSGEPLLSCDDRAGVPLSEAPTAKLRAYLAHAEAEQRRTVAHLEKRLRAASAVRERVQSHLDVVKQECATLRAVLQREEADYHEAATGAARAESARTRGETELAAALATARGADAELDNLRAASAAHEEALAEARVRRSNVDARVRAAQADADEVSAALVEAQAAQRARREARAAAERERAAAELRSTQLERRASAAMARREAQAVESAQLRTRQKELASELESLLARGAALTTLSSALGAKLAAQRAELEAAERRTRADNESWAAKSAKLAADEHALSERATERAGAEAAGAQAAREARASDLTLLDAERRAHAELEASVARAAERASALQLESEALRGTLENGVVEKRRLERTLHSLRREVQRVLRSESAGAGAGNGGAGGGAGGGSGSGRSSARPATPGAKTTVAALRAKLADVQQSIAAFEAHFEHQPNRTAPTSAGAGGSGGGGWANATAADVRRRKEDLVALARTLTDTQNDRELALAAQQATGRGLDARTRTLEAQLDAAAREARERRS